jgi:hypothetical protein
MHILILGSWDKQTLELSLLARPQPGQLTNYVPEITHFMEKNLLEPPYSSAVYLSLLPSKTETQSGEVLSNYGEYLQFQPLSSPPQ